MTLSYAELNTAAERLGAHLRQLRVAPEMIVGVFMERSWQLVVALLGILKAGGAYLPLDPDYPAERLQFMLRDARASIVLTQASLLKKIPEALRDSFRFVVYEDIPDTEGRAPHAGTSDNLALIIYTSGSTGTPKGIGISHQAVIRLVCNTNYLNLGPSDRVAQASNPSFDAITFEVWGALLNGCCLVGLSKEEALNPKLLGARIRDDGITAILLTTALFNQFAASEEADVLGELRYLFFGGEAADPSSVQEVLRYFPPRYLIHLYGPAENTTVTTWHRVESVPPGSTTVPIGRPITNTETYVLDKNMMPVATGIIGELYVGGDGLARGYVNRPDLTAENFVPNPFSLRGSERLYRTGDLVRYTSNGALEFAGRRDQQVKIRGHRIEPGEIESVLGQHSGVGESIVLVEDVNGQKRLLAYATVKESADEEELRRYLRERLPSYMMPASLVLLPELPLTDNGKIDRARLLQQAGSLRDKNQNNNYVAPRTELEQTIAAIWKELLGVEKVGVFDNIFDLGGHSLLLIQIHARMRKKLPEDSTKIMDLFLHPTIDSLVQFMRERESAVASVSE
jgi:amino acid adenylation domain-containing protein